MRWLPIGKMSILLHRARLPFLWSLNIFINIMQLYMSCHTVVQESKQWIFIRFPRQFNVVGPSTSVDNFGMPAPRLRIGHPAVSSNVSALHVP